ncbi:APG6-domain-containing protein [Cylindrobasidium torrendii FP15055 ss-10]|uniref:APG6-domain-containing protein n=1 Tax=Cylindrobasidium torrendii FP15055 ss-10 TaxID=1314674 RepID=A0A0D7BVR3_9AGAR|nr:APG6-domain-containing protein [Cylindrobasidium torrendii FP15055 ss-10]
MSFGLICQQCKEPLQLDQSLVDLAPSAYDMVVSSAPHSVQPSSSSIPYDRAATGVDKLGQLPADATVKSAWKRSQAGLSPRAQGKQPILSPAESFVLLQESTIRSIPPQVHASQQQQRRGLMKRVSKVPETPSVEPAIFDHHNPSPLSHHLSSTARLYNVLSSRTDIDHPLCAECTQILLNHLQRQLDETKKERDGYIAFDKELKKEREREGHGAMQKEEAEKKIERLKAEEKSVVQEVLDAERERDQLDHELMLLELEEKELEAEEDDFWRAHNEQLLAIDQQNMQLASLRAAYASDLATLEKLERANVYNDAFCIGHDGVFGTINGLRLGRVPGVPVEWAEINAAWGQTLLLLYTIGRKLDFTFENYRLVPMGSFSRIERTTADKSIYELYGSGDLHFGRLLHNRRFDLAMVGFIECLKQLMDYIKALDSSIDFPHQVVKDKIGDVSVKLQFNQEDAWTRALRHVLLALKMCLKWATNGANA